MAADKDHRAVVSELRGVEPKVVVFTTVPIAGSYRRSAAPGGGLSPLDRLPPLTRVLGRLLFYRLFRIFFARGGAPPPPPAMGKVRAASERNTQPSNVERDRGRRAPEQKVAREQLGDRDPALKGLAEEPHSLLPTAYPPIPI